MPVKYFVQRGRVACISQGRNAGKLCTIVDIIDQNRALVSGPVNGVRRQPLSFKKMRLTRFLMKDIHPTIGDKALSQRWKDLGIVEQFQKTKSGMRLAAKKKKAKMTDFDRFKLYKTKQRINRLVAKKTEKLMAADKRKRKEIRKGPKQQAKAKK